jgi:hypothetical protein
MPYRWHAWVSALTSGKHQHILFEMTAQASKPLALYRKAYGTIRGAVFDATRPSRRSNGRVTLQVKQGDLANLKLPEPPDLVKCLAIIWNIATPSFNVADLLKGVPHVRMKDGSQPIIHRPNDETHVA